MTRNRSSKSAKPGNRQVARLEAEIAKLRQQLATTQAALRQVEQGGADAFLARRLTELEEGQQVARGQALEAAAARSRAEGELRALKDVVEKTPGLAGWLMRRAKRRLGG